MRPHGKTKLGFFPLPPAEADRLKNCLAFPSEFSALDRCAGDGVAFDRLLEGPKPVATALKLTRTGPSKQLG
jgi:hypothetical protein